MSTQETRSCLQDKGYAVGHSSCGLSEERDQERPHEGSEAGGRRREEGVQGEELE